jgi:hypothetical protein
VEGEIQSIKLRGIAVDLLMQAGGAASINSKCRRDTQDQMRLFILQTNLKQTHQQYL